MNEKRTIKGRLMELAARLAVAGPWRTPVERLACAMGHKFPESRTVLSFCRYFGRQLIRREGKLFERVVTFPSGGKMRCGPDEKLAPICSMYYFLGTITNQDEDERPLVKLLNLAVRKGDTFFDVGANVGFYSFFVGPLCGTTGAVHAFEANPLLIEHLLRSADLNRPQANIVVNPVAVGAEGNKTLQLYDPDRIGCSSLYQLEWLDAGNSVTVPLTTIDDYRREKSINRLDVMKIDIEGAELDAFHGMEETFATCPPWLILCELALLIGPGSGSAGHADAASQGSNPREIIKFLCTKGYEPRYVDETDGRLGRVVERGALEQLTQNLINIAFVRSDLHATRPELFCA